MAPHFFHVTCPQSLHLQGRRGWGTAVGVRALREGGRPQAPLSSSLSWECAAEITSSSSHEVLFSLETGEYLGAFGPLFGKGDQSWISSSIDGREDGCPGNDLAASICFMRLCESSCLSSRSLELPRYFAFSILYIRCPGSQMSRAE